MRKKLIVGAVAASATLALAGAQGVLAQDPTVTFDATVKPSDAGTPTNPKNASLSVGLAVNRPGQTVGTIVLSLPKGLKFSGKGFKKCNAEALIANGRAACPAGSKAGPRGTASARVEPGDSALDFNIYPFVGSEKKFLFYLAQTVDGVETGTGIQAVLTGNITNKGRKLSIPIPHELRQPVPGLNATLTGIDATFAGKRGGKYIVSSTGCTDRTWKVKGSLIFSARSDNPTPPPTASLSDSVRCSK